MTKYRSDQLSVSTTDNELKAITICYDQLRQFSFDTQWRIFNYLIGRFFGRGWLLGKPSNDR